MKKGSAAARDKENDNTKGFLSTEDDDEDEDEDNENNDDELRNNDDAHSSSSSSSIHAHTHKQNKLRRELLYIKAHVVLTQHKQTMIKIRSE